MRATGLFCGALFSLLASACQSSDAGESSGVIASDQPLMAAAFGHLATLHPFAAAVSATLRSAGERLVDLQADQLGDNAGNGLVDADPDDGGWDWTLPDDATEHTANASPDNLFGETALGVLSAVRASAGSARMRTALLDVGLGMQANPQIDSAQDVVFLTLLAQQVDNPGFSELARNRYDLQLTAAGGAHALAEQARDERHAAAEDGLIAYDLAWLSLAASALDGVFAGAGYAADAKTFAGVAVADLSSSSPLFDRNDLHEAFYTHGLAWSLVALSRDGSRVDLLESARAALIEQQLPSGAWGWSADYPDANVQATAYATTALMLSTGAGLPAYRAAAGGAGWLLQHQAANGGWHVQDALENPEVDADAMYAIYLVELGGKSALASLNTLANDAAPSTAWPPCAAARAH